MSVHDDVIAQVRAALEAEHDINEGMARTVRILKSDLPYYHWVGIYLLHSNELVLGPFEGAPSPHTHIPLGRGICGAAAAEKQTIIVEDVHSDSRYLACSVDTRSEIVVPIMNGDEVLGELDIDSDHPNAFNHRDKELLEAVAALIAPKLAASFSPRA